MFHPQNDNTTLYFRKKIKSRLTGAGGSERDSDVLAELRALLYTASEATSCVRSSSFSKETTEAVGTTQREKVWIDIGGCLKGGNGYAFNRFAVYAASALKSVLSYLHV